MIVYGTNATTIGEGKVSHEVCPNCGAEDHIHVGVFSQYAHIYWIPLFPFRKKKVAKCTSCGYEMEKKEMPSPILEAANQIASQSKTPIWQFAGLGIIVLFFGWISYQNGVDEDNYTEYAHAPQIADVIEYDVEEGYSNMRVIRVTSDSVFVHLNMYATDKRTAVDELDVDSMYLPIEIGFSREKIVEMWEDQEIFKINR
ncbi:MAG: hypothetical protein AAFY71_25335 [Bacteroidota bacterium]